jgi:DNA primase
MSIQSFAKNIKERSEMFAEVVSASKSLLHNCPVAEKHLSYIKTRLSDKEITNYDIGYFPDNNNISLLEKYIKEKTLNDLKLVYNAHVPNRGHINIVKKGVFHYHNLIIPLIDEYGNIITLAGRSILSKEERKSLKIPKYKGAPIKKQLFLFGLDKAQDHIEKKNSVIIVEGQIDCIKCQSRGFLNTVALNGSELTIQQVFIIKRKTNNFNILLDNDKAGKEAANKIIKNYSEFINIKIINLPNEYKDVDEYLTNSPNYDIMGDL